MTNKLTVSKCTASNKHELQLIESIRNGYELDKNLNAHFSSLYCYLSTTNDLAMGI